MLDSLKFTLALIMNQIKYYICPMSRAIVDSVIELNSPLIGLIPSRRQIEFDGGYVNNWNTISFAEYIKNKSNIIIERDHAGAGQNDVDEYHSYWIDSKVMDIVHIDPWRRFPDLDGGVKETIENIKFLHQLNPNLKLEVGTEEEIRPFSFEELEDMVIKLKEGLSESEFNSIIYICIQSGVKLDLVNQKNVGHFSINKLRSMLHITKKYQKLSKEHNGDYLNDQEIKVRFNSGLDALNIGPEIVQIETKTYIENMNQEQIDEFYSMD